MFHTDALHSFASLRSLSKFSSTALLASLLACGGGGGEGTDTAGSTGGTGSTGATGVTDGSSSGGPGSSSGGDGSSSGDSGGPELDPRLADCLRINACEADGGAPIGLQACLSYALDEPWSWASTGVAQLDLETMACKLAATDCAGVLACSPAKDAFAAACADNPLSDVCVGDVWVFCDDVGAPTAAMDCAAAGLACDKQIWAGCGGEPCEFGVDPSECDPADPTVLRECDPSGWWTRVDCPTQYNFVHVNGKDGEQVFSIAGEVCGFDEQRQAFGCVGTGEACDFFSQACEGDVLATCAGGKIGRRDCAALSPAGQGCGFMQSGAFAGAASCGYVEPACDLGGAEACADGVVSYCAYDQPATIDCAAHGYAGCAAGELGGRAIAWCTP